MSVYTVINEAEMEELLDYYSIGELISYQGISEGIENTNYFVNTTHGNYVLTIFEKQAAEDLPYFLDLMTHISNAGFFVPKPAADKTGQYLQTLYGKPATFITRLAGHTISTTTIKHCEGVGKALATIHTTTKDFRQIRNNQRDLHWCQNSATTLLPLLPKTDAKLLLAEIHHHQAHPPNNIPQGVIHADLFRDNVLFNQEVLTGIIDFYYACNDTYLYDLAIAANDWCVNNEGSFEIAKYRALIDAYHKQRPFSHQEPRYWQNALRRAALRFWISRLYDKYFPRIGSITHTKDPDFLKQILLNRILETPSLC